MPACQGCAQAQRKLQTERDKRVVNKLQLTNLKANLKATQAKLDSLLQSQLPPRAQAEEPEEASESESDDEDL